MPARAILGLRRHSPTSSTTTLGAGAGAGKKDSAISLIPPYANLRSDSQHHQHSNSTRSSMEHIRKTVGRKSSTDNGRGSKAEAARSARITFEVESPPILFHNGPDNSSGAIFSGQLKVDVTAPAGVTFESLSGRFVCATSTKRPVVGHCPECIAQSAELKRWDFLTERLALARGQHKFPLTHLLPGHLPATTQSQLGNLEYKLVAEARTSAGETITFSEPVRVMRAILPLPEPRKSMRVFPPTELTAHVTLQPVVHPIGDIPVELRLDGTTTRHEDGHAMRWRLRRLNWRIEEHCQIVSPACARHAGRVGGDGNGVQHEDTRVIADAELRDGWKTDLDAGTVECEFAAALDATRRFACGVRTPGPENRLEVTHALVVEMVVAEEYVPPPKKKGAPMSAGASPTGSARVLRTQFALTLTERAGMGISWDEESPPMYHDVPPSPPIYKVVTQCEDFDVKSLEE